VVAALDARLLLREHRAGDPQRVLEALEALAQGRELEAVRTMLVLEPRGADAEPRAPAGDDVERGGGLREQRRVAVGDAADEQPERHARRPRRERAEHHVPLEHVVRLRADPRDLVQVVHHRDRAEPCVLRRAHDLDDVLEDFVGADARVVEVREVEVERDWGAHRFTIRPALIRPSPL
jgi:hypothetical protein